MLVWKLGSLVPLSSVSPLGSSQSLTVASLIAYRQSLGKGIGWASLELEPLTRAGQFLPGSLWSILWFPKVVLLL